MPHFNTYKQMTWSSIIIWRKLTGRTFVISIKSMHVYVLTFWNIHLLVSKFSVRFLPVPWVTANVPSWCTTETCISKYLELMRNLFIGTCCVTSLNSGKTTWRPPGNKSKNDTNQEKASTQTPNYPPVNSMTLLIVLNSCRHSRTLEVFYSSTER